ncbi:hypothetical protein [uncultured Parabacteroides sp.]|uniref:hypothetical protein n=1 Tax=uncultured Parabacteroides sp. TaxID=512312 RepID=UPI00259B3E95|nr:hypothetical protein [uncultured Parabacteroides sp.]
MTEIFKRMTNLLFLLCLAACSGKSDVVTLLREAEMYMDERPDSALCLLDSVKSMGELTGQEHALWCLLYTQAQDKNRIEHTSDSLIQIAVKYYDGTDLEDRKMQAYYYCGRVFQDLSDAPQAQGCYLKAYEVGKNLNNNSLLGRLCANLGTLYTYQELYQPALDFQKEAADYFLLDEDTVSLSIAFRNIARIYICENLSDSAKTYYSKALSYTSDVHAFYIFNELADAYGRIGEYEKGLSYARKANTLTQTVDDSCLVSFTLGDIFLKTGQLDSADHYLSFCLRSPNIYTLAGTYYLLGQLEKRQNNLEQYVLFQEKYEPLKDSIEQQSRMETLIRNQCLYDYRAVEKEKEYYRQEAYRTTIRLYRIYLGAILFVIAVFIFFVYRSKKQRQKEEQLNQSLRLKDQDYRQSQAFLKEKEDSIARLMEKLELEQKKREGIIYELGKQIEQERQEKEKIVVRLNEVQELAQKKNAESEEQLRNQLEVQIQMKEEIEERLKNQLELEQSKKEAVEKRLKLTIDLTCESKNKQALLSNTDITKEEALFYDSDDYIGLYSDWIKLAKDEWQILQDRIDCILYIDFTHRLKSLYPNISILELQICCLTKLRIPVKRIAVLLSTNSQTISVYRKRLYTKFTGKKGSAKDLDLFLFDF